MSGVTLKNRRIAATNSMWNIYFDHIADQRGNEVTDYLVIEGRQKREDLVTGVAILPVVDGRFVLLRSYRHALSREIWEFPRGFVDAGESPRQAALRELSEETSLQCRAEHVIPLGFYIPDAGTIAARCALFAAVRCQGVPRLPSDEIGLDALQVLDREALEKLIASNTIEDAGTLIAFYRYCALQPAAG